VLSHHLKATDPGGDHPWCQPRGRFAVELHLAHPEVAAMFARVRDIAELPPPPPLPAGPWSEAPPWGPTLQQGYRHANKLRRALHKDRARQVFVAALKVGVIAADSAASGLVRTGEPITEWIEAVAHRPALGADELEQHIIASRCDELTRKHGKPFEFHEFQRRAATIGPRALLLAGCGSGKTLAAWKWAHAQLQAHELGYVVFLYPTRGTATEGFRDYVGWAPESKAALVHGTSEYELAAMQENPSEAIRDKRVRLSEVEMRLFSLGLWQRWYFSATVDQFLAFLEHRYESLCLVPLLADSAVILDEVHSYDATMFERLIAFLENFHGPVLCMTATLPSGRRDQLERAGLRVYPGDADRTYLRDLEAIELHPRYCIEPVAGPDAAFERAVSAYRQGKRVLWVVNTVNRCQVQARKLGDALDTPVLAYHSRYRLCDRQRIHGLTVEAFQQRGRAALAVTTQVCEMSLDLDADVLITEHAPIPSLVQRLGRANRHARPPSPERAAVYLYAPENVLPYKKDDLAAACAFLDHIGVATERTVEISQRALAEALERTSRAEPEATGYANLLHAGYFAAPGSFRDTDEFSVPCVLDSDLAELERIQDDRRAFHKVKAGLELSVPRGHVLAHRPAWLPPYLHVASGRRYHPELGFLTQGDRE
jgi:CRISPR-associated endonuclease/helicase Cas3